MSVTKPRCPCRCCAIFNAWYTVCAHSPQTRLLQRFTLFLVCVIRVLFFSRREPHRIHRKSFGMPFPLSFLTRKPKRLKSAIKRQISIVALFVRKNIEEHIYIHSPRGGRGIGYGHYVGNVTLARCTGWGSTISRDTHSLRLHPLAWGWFLSASSITTALP